jgi:hypothetical protein
MILQIGCGFGLRALRVPLEPLWFATRGAALAGATSTALLAPWVALMKRSLRARGIAYNDWVFGIAGSGSLDEDALLEVLARLPAGVSEIYLHPATYSEAAITLPMAKYRHTDELSALLSVRVRDALAASGAVCGGYSDVGRAPAGEGR